MVIDRVLAILKLLDTYEEGQVLLPTGQHEIEIFTRKDPVEVWIKSNGVGDLNVCQGDIDSFNAQPILGGFILYANVKSESLSLSWRAEFDPDV